MLCLAFHQRDGKAWSEDKNVDHENGNEPEVHFLSGLETAKAYSKGKKPVVLMTVVSGCQLLIFVALAEASNAWPRPFLSSSKPAARRQVQFVKIGGDEYLGTGPVGILTVERPPDKSDEPVHEIRTAHQPWRLTGVRQQAAV